MPLPLFMALDRLHRTALGKLFSGALLLLIGYVAAEIVNTAPVAVARPVDFPRMDRPAHLMMPRIVPPATDVPPLAVPPDAVPVETHPGTIRL